MNINCTRPSQVKPISSQNFPPRVASLGEAWGWQGETELGPFWGGISHVLDQEAPEIRPWSAYNACGLPIA